MLETLGKYMKVNHFIKTGKWSGNQQLMMLGSGKIFKGMTINCLNV